MTETKREKISDLLHELEQVLVKFELWTDVPPAADAFASQAPFCMDTMEFTEWLQWVFISRMRALLDMGAPLPERCLVAPMAEEYFKGAPTTGADNVTGLLTAIDHCFAATTLSDEGQQLH